MLVDRLRTSAALIAIVVVLLLLDLYYPPIWSGAGGFWLLPLLLFFSLGTAWDLVGLMARSGRASDRPVAIAATAVITLSAAVPMLWPLTGSAYPPDCPIGRLGWIVVASVTGTFGVLVREVIRFRVTPREGIERALSGVFVSHYVGVPMALLIALRGLGGDPRWGLAALVTTIAVTKSSDAGAYFVGKLVGRHKLIPWLSPGKTWEGVLGGIVAATLVAAACLRWGFPGAPSIGALSPSPYWAIVLGPVLAVSGMAGDLAESFVKRLSGAKDSGNWLPGLGGVWDVTDSLIAAVMPAFLCFAAAA